MNKIISILIGSITIILSGCVKNADHFTDFGTVQPILELRTAVYDGAGGNEPINIAGLANFSSSSMAAVRSYFPDTISFFVNLASDQVLTRNINVKVGIDQSIRNAYNADTISNSIKYDPLPDSVFTWTDKTVTIPAGQRVGRITGLIIDYDKIDPSVNYMLPIAIINGDGVNVSSNQGAIYFHAIGNPLAGSYYWNWHRWNAADSTSVPRTGSSFDSSNTVLAPKSATIVEVPSGYYIQPRYTISFTNNGGVLSNLKVSFNADDVATMSGNGVTVSGITIIAADFAKKYFKFQYTATTANGPRYITDEYYK